MSSGAVELPLVPSARAPSSASSSASRRSLHSAGSTASYVSSKSYTKSYREDDGDEDDEDEQQEDEQDDEQDDDQDDDQDDEPHESSSSSSSSSGGLWDEVEHFLNKPSPSFGALATKDTLHATATTLSSSGSRASASSSSRSVLPTLSTSNSSGERSRKQPVAPGNQSQSSVSRGNRPSRGHATTTTTTMQSSSGTKTIDPKLLQEAFAYAQRIQSVNFDDEEDEETNGQPQQQRVGMLRRDSSFGATGSGSGSGHGSSGGPRMPSELKKQGSGSGSGSFRSGKPEDKILKKKSSKPTRPGATTKATSAYGASVKPAQPAAKKKPSERRMRESGAASSEWDPSPVSSADPNGDGASHSRKGSVASSSSLDQQTLQSLVSNLQNGTALEELRRELVASQQSMAMSRQVIQDAAKSFFHTGTGIRK